MKNSRFKRSYRESASKFHRKVGDILNQSPIFKNYRIYQEYPVDKINPQYRNSSHRFDWVILDLNVVIELHGKQHYEWVSFSKDQNDSSSLYEIRSRDRRKREAAIEAGYIYIEIPYTKEKELNDEFLWKTIQEEIRLRPEKTILLKEDGQNRRLRSQERQSSSDKQKEYLRKRRREAYQYYKELSRKRNK